MEKTIPLHVPVAIGFFVGLMIFLLVTSFELVIAICLALISTELIHAGAFVAGVIATVFSIVIVIGARYLILSFCSFF